MTESFISELETSQYLETCIMNQSNRNRQELSVAATLTALANPPQRRGHTHPLVAPNTMPPPNANQLFPSSTFSAPTKSQGLVPKTKQLESQTRKNIGVSKMTFARKLFEIVDNPAHSEIVTWLPDGKRWIIVDKKRFASEILPKYFKQSQFTSFTRRLIRWKFKRVSKGTWMGAYHHELFRKDRKYLCMFMSCNDDTPSLKSIAEKIKVASEMIPENRAPPQTPVVSPQRPECNSLTSLEEMNKSIIHRQLLDLRRRKAELHNDNARLLLNLQVNRTRQEFEKIAHLRRNIATMQRNAALNMNAISFLTTIPCYSPELLIRNYQLQQQQRMLQHPQQGSQHPQQYMNMPIINKPNIKGLLTQPMLPSLAVHVQRSPPLSQKKTRRASAA